MSQASSLSKNSLESASTSDKLWPSVPVLVSDRTKSCLPSALAEWAKSTVRVMHTCSVMWRSKFFRLQWQAIPSVSPQSIAFASNRANADSKVIVAAAGAECLSSSNERRTLKALNAREPQQPDAYATVLVRSVLGASARQRADPISGRD